MNYQHYYHAGNSADVFKHLVLITLLNYLRQKEKPFCYIDTHAGSGEYDLTLTKNQEWQEGIGRLQQAAQSSLFQDYLKDIQDLHHFPGSPCLAKKLLRKQDEMILIEKSTAAYANLQLFFHHDKQVHLHQADAYSLLKGLLPPPIKRGLVLIDPPYEEKDEEEHIITLLQEALKRFSTSIYAVWYPIKSRARTARFYEALKKQIAQEILIIEFCPWPDDIAIRLNGSGMAIIHPPWQLQQTLTPLLKALIQILKQHPKGFYAFKVLV